MLGALNDEIIMPSLKKYLIYDNGASQKGKGTSFAEKRLKGHLQKFFRRHGNDGYILKMDFEKYFDNIDHEQAEKLLFKYVNCDERLKSFICGAVDTFCLSVDDETAGKEVINTLEIKAGGNILRRSVAIGNPMAQSIGILYAHPADTYCKHVKGCKFYGRYMDDIYVIHQSKDFLKELLAELETVCKENALHINQRKTGIIKLSRGFSFLKKKYTVTGSGKIFVGVTKTAIQREKRRLKKLRRFMADKELENCYMAWRQNLIKRYNCYKKIQHIDNFYGRLKNAKQRN